MHLNLSVHSYGKCKLVRRTVYFVRAKICYSSRSNAFSMYVFLHFYSMWFRSKLCQDGCTLHRCQNFIEKEKKMLWKCCAHNAYAYTYRLEFTVFWNILSDIIHLNSFEWAHMECLEQQIFFFRFQRGVAWIEDRNFYFPIRLRYIFGKGQVRWNKVYAEAAYIGVRRW